MKVLEFKKGEIMRKIIILSLTVLWIFFIFYNSMQDAQSSSEVSSKFTNFFNELIQFFNIKIRYDILSKIIRKLAHVFEYFVLGIFLFNSLIIYFKKHIYFYTFTVAIFIAIIDEIIQLFSSGRFGSIFDVLIDGIGIVLGLFCCYFTRKIVAKKKSKTILNI